MKLSQIALGRAAERPTEFPVIDAEGLVVTVKALVRVIDGTEETKGLVYAAQYATDNGATDAREGHPLWDLGFMAKIVHLACLDPESPEKKREPTFDSVEQVLSLPRETIAFLFEAQQVWQDQCSPTVKRFDANKLLDHVRELAESESDLPFLRLSPALRLILLRSMAALLMSAPEAKSLGSSSSASAGPDTSESTKTSSTPSKSSDARPESTTNDAATEAPEEPAT
jgi:hypothetical protein